MTAGDQDSLHLRSLSGLAQRDRIQILLSEYSALRQEIMSRTGFGFQIAAVSFALVSWVFSISVSDRPFYFRIIVALVTPFFAIAVFVNVRDLNRAAHRVKEIEHEVNSRAWEHLLVWETLSGVLTRMGLTKSFLSPIRTLPRSQLPPLDPSYLREEGNRRKDD